ncbi:MAG: hypothetical protein L7U62_07130 [Candidatus Poseidoniaceae archaeon]|nr:hypothetical protein [Candidatus Poseidoniaceae archaeon]
MIRRVTDSPLPTIECVESRGGLIWESTLLPSALRSTGCTLASARGGDANEYEKRNGAKAKGVEAEPNAA